MIFDYCRIHHFITSYFQSDIFSVSFTPCGKLGYSFCKVLLSLYVGTNSQKLIWKKYLDCPLAQHHIQVCASSRKTAEDTWTTCFQLSAIQTQTTQIVYIISFDCIQKLPPLVYAILPATTMP